MLWARSSVGRVLHSHCRSRGFDSHRVHQEKVCTVRYGPFLYFMMGVEGRAVQSNSPVDCCDRERPSDRSRANRLPSGPPEKSIAFAMLFSIISTLWVGEILLRNVKYNYGV